VGDIDTIAMGGLKALDPNWPIREADIGEIGDQSSWMNLTLFRDCLPGAAHRGWEVFQFGQAIRLRPLCR
jgi:hypothetical protein